VEEMATASSRPTILVVEDEPQILEIIAFLLEEENFRVLQASDGEAALSLLKEIEPDLIISDIRMPGIDGFTLCEQVRSTRTFSQIPFIFLTAKGERADIRRGMGLGADDYLIKPFEPEELLSAVRVRLARAAETQAAIAAVGSDLQDQIIRTLTHEFRTPLSLVVGYTELLESSGQQMNERDFQAALQGLHSGSSRLMNLIEDFLLLSRLRTGITAREIGEAPPDPLHPDQVVRLVLEQAQSQGTGRTVSLVFDSENPALSVAIEPQHLAEIVRRLTDNAIRFSRREGGHVAVTTRQEGHSWALSIADNGIGIPQEALPWLFEAFRQVDRAQMEQQGAGVGLAIVQGLVEAYGGRLGVASASGKGSTFTVWLPLAEDSSQR
jgi:two-component system sensor histidine kinase/response regulator